MGIVVLTHRTPSPMAQLAIECVKDVAGQVNAPPAGRATPA
jgi:hypothetical protein